MTSSSANTSTSENSAIGKMTWSKWRRTIAGAVVILVAGLLVLGLFHAEDVWSAVKRGEFVVRHQAYTCALCRAEKLRTTYLGFLPMTRFAETNCSKWYAQNVEPRHTHMWVEHPVPSTRGTCYIGPPQIWMIPPDQQLGFYQHYPDKLKARDLFADAAQDHSGMRVATILFNLNAWSEVGYAGSWEDFQERYHAALIASSKAHRDYNAWKDYLNLKPGETKFASSAQSSP